MKMNDAFMLQLIQTLTSEFGGNKVLRTRNGKTELMNSPDFSKRILSKKQMEMNYLMHEASNYARGIIKNKKLKDAAQIRLDVSSNRLYHALVREYLKKEIPKNDILSVKK